MDSIFSELEKNLQEIADFVKSQLDETLVLQGHEATGKLIREHETRIKKEIDKIAISGYAPFYAIIVDKGVTAKRIPYKRNPPNRGGTSKYITALMEWARVKGMAHTDKEMRNIAFAIANTHAKEGMPTSHSNTFSQTGKRTGWVTDTLKEKHSIIDLFISKFVDKDFEYFKRTYSTLIEDAVK